MAIARKALRLYWWNNWIPLAMIILIIVSVPIFTIFLKLFAPAGESWTHIRSTLLGGYFYNTLLLVVGVAALTSLIGIGTAWIVSSFEFPGRKYFEWLLILPLSVPGYIMAFAYVGFLEYTGPLATFLREQFGISFQGPILDIMNLPGAILILSLSLFPYVYVITRASFLQQSRYMQEASFLLGSNRLRTFFKVALPMARPAVVGGVSLAIMEVLNDYGTVKYFGVNTFTTGIFRAWFSLGDATTAIYLSAILVGIVLLILYLENRQRGQRRYSSLGKSQAPQGRVMPSSKNKLLYTGICASVVGLSFLIPLLQLLYWVSLTWQKVAGLDFIMLIFNSFLLAAFTGLIIVLLAVVMLYMIRISPFSWLRFIPKLGTLGYAIPGAVIAVGIMIPLIGLDKSIMRTWPEWNWGLMLSGTLFALIFAYVVRFMAVGYNPIDAGFQKQGLHVNEASRLLGHHSLKTLWRIDLPLVKTSLMSAVLLVFVDVLKELPLTLILRPFNFHTLATKAFDMATNEMIAESANASLVIILTGIIPIIVLNKLILKSR